jgi:drug/metabolite transporter (DMT)-like permease
MRPHGPDRPLLGIVALIIGLGVLSTQDVVMKNLSPRYSVLELLFVRTLFSVLALELALALAGWPRPLATARIGMQCLRGVVLLFGLGCYYVALSVMTLLDVVAIFYTAPLFATALSALILKERVGLRRSLAVLVGFSGALLMIRPGGESALGAASVFAIASAGFYAVSILLTRSLGATEPAVTTAYYTLLAYIVLGGAGTGIVDALAARGHGVSELSLTREWVTPDLGDLVLLGVSGLWVSVAFLCLAQAYRFASIPVLAPLEYTAVLWAGVLGFIAWGDVPEPISLAGAVLIVVSGVYVSRARA